MRDTTLLAAVALVVAACTTPADRPGGSPSAEPAAVVGAAPTSATPRPADAVTPTASPATIAAATAVRFIDPLRGWLGVEDGIVGTTDGGITWDRQLTAGRITKLWVYDATRAWALAADDSVYRTRDGVHWTAIPPTNPPIAEIDAFSPDHVWAIGVARPSAPEPAQRVGSVLVSDDGGFIWRPIGTHTMWSICFDTATDGVGAEGKRIWRTADAGRTWTPAAELPIRDDGPAWYPTLTCPTGTQFRVQVTEPNAALSHAPYLVYRTNDGGRSWALEFREGYTLGGTTPSSTPQLGSYPSILGSFLAGGRAWFITCSPPVDSQEFLLFGPTGDAIARGPVPIPGCAMGGQVLDAKHVVAISWSASSVIATDDAGATWRPIYRWTPRR